MASAFVQVFLKMIVFFLNFQHSLISGQVKLGIHAMRICQIKGGSDSNNEVMTATLMALLNLLESRIAFNNVFLRHHVFGILQILAGRLVHYYLSFLERVVEFFGGNYCRIKEQSDYTHLVINDQ